MDGSLTDPADTLTVEDMSAVALGMGKGSCFAGLPWTEFSLIWVCCVRLAPYWAPLMLLLQKIWPLLPS